MELAGSLPHSQKPATWPHPKPAKSGLCPSPTFQISTLILFNIVHLPFPSSLRTSSPHKFQYMETASSRLVSYRISCACCERFWSYSHQTEGQVNGNFRKTPYCNLKVKKSPKQTFKRLNSKTQFPVLNEVTLLFPHFTILWIRHVIIINDCKRLKCTRFAAFSQWYNIHIKFNKKEFSGWKYRHAVMARSHTHTHT
jgi:hypothetical protein